MQWKIIRNNTEKYKKYGKLIEWVQPIKHLKITIPLIHNVTDIPLTLYVKHFYYSKLHDTFFSQIDDDSTSFTLRRKNNQLYDQFYLDSEETTSLSLNLDGFYENQIKLNFYFCKDSTCQDK